MDENKLVKAESNSPSILIQSAISGGADLDKLEKLLTLQERWEQNEAKKAYFKSMAQFKANPPKIDKDRTVAYGNTKYTHASLANVTEKISAELSKYGLSASWSTKQNGSIAVTCRITHELGYSEETTITAPADKSGSKNDIQSIGSTITYLERYTILALTGLATSDMDDDGVASGNKTIEYISKDEINKILDMLAEVDGKLPNFLGYLKVASLDVLPKADYPKALSALTAVKNKKGTVKK